MSKDKKVSLSTLYGTVIKNKSSIIVVKRKSPARLFFCRRWMRVRYPMAALIYTSVSRTINRDKFPLNNPT